MENSSIPVGFSVASAVIEEHALSLLVETFLFALYVVLVAYLLCWPWINHKTASLPPFMQLVTPLMFAIYVLYWTLDVYLLWAEYHSLLSPQPTSSQGPDIESVHWKGASAVVWDDGLDPKYYAAVYVQYIVQLTLIMLGDAVSLWRAYVIFGKQRWLYIAIGGVLFSESMVYILVFASSTTEYLSFTVPSFVDALSEFRTPLTFIGYSVTGLAQIGSTALIAYKTWNHWREIRAFMDHSMQHHSLIALVVIIETGVIYLALLSWYGAIDYWGPPASVATYTCRFSSVPLIAMYPTLVVVLVASRRSVLEHSIGSAAHTGKIRRAVAGFTHRWRRTNPTHRGARSLDFEFRLGAGMRRFNYSDMEDAKTVSTVDDDSSPA